LASKINELFFVSASWQGISPMNQRITVLIPCKDEAHNISPCIESIGTLADEILIADSGSTDGTLQIARRLQKPDTSLRIIQREYVNPSDFKNWAIPQASNSWILTLDADERVTEALREEIRLTIAAEPVLDAYRIPRKNIFLGKKVRFSGWQHDAPLRLFHRDRCRYDNRRIHEHLLVAPGKTGMMQASILHNTCESLEEMLTKSIRYGSLAAEDLDQAGKHIGVMPLLVRPAFRFLRHFIWKQGFRDGSIGLLLACLAAQGAFIKYALLWARQRERLITDRSRYPDENTFAVAQEVSRNSSPFAERENVPAQATSPHEYLTDIQPEPRALTMPGIHEKVQAVVDQLPRGTLLDVGAGEGAFSKWANEKGFEVHATDVNQKDFRLPGIPFTQTNLSGRWPFMDDSFDLVVSVEVLEHVENHYHFLSECCRICKPSGRIILSTPNCHSIESRLNVLLSGFDDCAPRPINYSELQPEKIYMEHIHPAPLATIELGLRRCGFEIEDSTFNRHRRLSLALLPFAYPLIWWRTYRQMLLSEKDPQSRERNRKLMRLFLDRRLLTGRISIFTCRQVEKDLTTSTGEAKEFRCSA